MRNFWLRHSAKGSEWEEHKYIKKADGKYYYPDSYEGGRHLESSEKRIEKDSEIDDDLRDKMANDVIKGLFGNGALRKELLGENYEKIQSRVNELLKGKAGNIKIEESSKSEVVKETKKVVEKVVKNNGGMDLDVVYSVYKKKK